LAVSQVCCAGLDFGGWPGGVNVRPVRTFSDTITRGTKLNTSVRINADPLSCDELAEEKQLADNILDTMKSNYTYMQSNRQQYDEYDNQDSYDNYDDYFNFDN